MSDGGQDGRPGTAGGGRLVKTKQQKNKIKQKKKENTDAEEENNV